MMPFDGGNAQPFAAALSGSRPSITYKDGAFLHNGHQCRVVLRPDRISIGCSDVSIEAAKRLLALYESRFGCPDEYVVQS